MAERGIRMRVDLGEVVGEANSESFKPAYVNDEDEVIDEIEYNAQELRRLKPY